MEVSGQLHVIPFYPRGKQHPPPHSSHCVEGWEGPRDGGLDVMDKRKIPCFYRESNPESSVVQPLL
jgi:hypothetical protein